MRDQVKERVLFGRKARFRSRCRRSSEIDVQLARSTPSFPILADMANRLVPGVQIDGTGPCADTWRSIRRCILTFSRQQKTARRDGVPLSQQPRARCAVARRHRSRHDPTSGLLAGRDEEVSAIYVWAIATVGRAMAGLGNVAEHLASDRGLSPPICYRPAIERRRARFDDRDSASSRSRASSRDLWCYQRPWNRLPPHMPASFVSAGSFADARH